PAHVHRHPHEQVAVGEAQRLALHEWVVEVARDRLGEPRVGGPGQQHEVVGHAANRTAPAQNMRDALTAVNGSPPMSTGRKSPSVNLRRSNSSASPSAAIAPNNSTGRAPMRSTIGPPIRLPNGTVPPNSMNHSGITVARSRLARFCWNIEANAVATAK